MNKEVRPVEDKAENGWKNEDAEESKNDENWLKIKSTKFENEILFKGL